VGGKGGGERETLPITYISDGTGNRWGFNRLPMEVEWSIEADGQASERTGGLGRCVTAAHQQISG